MVRDHDAPSLLVTVSELVVNSGGAIPPKGGNATIGRWESPAGCGSLV
jgi:hypothetical protein